MRFKNIDITEATIELNSYQVGYFIFEINDNTKAFMIIDMDPSTQDLGLSVSFSKFRYYNPYRFISYKQDLHVQLNLPLVVSMSSVLPTDTHNIKVENGYYHFNIENMTGSLKTFKIQEQL